MNHEEATQYLDRLGDQVPDRRPPAGELLKAGKFAERRRTRAAIFLVAASAAAVVGGGVAFQQLAPDDSTVLDRGVAGAPTTAAIPDESGATSSPSLPGESAVRGPCPPSAPSTQTVDPATVPAPDNATGLTMNDSKTVAAWFEPASGPLPFLVVYDLAAGKELAREDLGPDEDLRSSTLRIDDEALYYASSADAGVWLRYRWGADEYPSVFANCN